MVLQVHAMIISHLKSQMPALFGKKKKQEALLANLEGEFLKIQHMHHMAAGDFPNPNRFKQSLAHYDFDKFKPYREDIIMMAEQVRRFTDRKLHIEFVLNFLLKALSKDLPKVMAMFPTSVQPQLASSELNPFIEFDPEAAMANNELPPEYWHVDTVDHEKYRPMFESLEPADGVLVGSKIKPCLLETGLPNNVLADIWRLSDYDNDGTMDIHQFSIAMHFVAVVKNGGSLPEKLPSAMQPKPSGLLS
jgi:hypothetical protein